MNLKFSLSDLRIGAEVLPPGTTDPASVDSGSILTNYIVKGALYALLAGVLIFVPTILIMKKETN